MVTSTASEMGRIPICVSRLAIHGGDGACGSTPRTTRATKRSQPGAPVDRRVVGEHDGVPVGVGRGDRDVGRVAEGAGGRALAVPVLAGETAQREAVAAVGGDVDLDDLVGEAEQRDGVVAGLHRGGRLRAEERCSTMMPEWSSPRPSSSSAQIIPFETWP